MNFFSMRTGKPLGSFKLHDLIYISLDHSSCLLGGVDHGKTRLEKAEQLEGHSSGPPGDVTGLNLDRSWKW